MENQRTKLEERIKFNEEKLVNVTRKLENLEREKKTLEAKIENQKFQLGVLQRKESKNA